MSSSDADSARDELEKRAVKDPLEHRVEAALEESDEGWERLCMLNGIPDGGMVALTHGRRHLLVHRQGAEVSCMTNACPHRGERLDFGRIENGVLTCPFHDWEFVLKTGRCLTVPQDALTMHPARVRDGCVMVRLAR